MDSNIDSILASVRFGSDLGKVYDPSEDTFLFMEALQKDEQFLKELSPCICVEIGCGSGCVITYLAQLLGCDKCWYFATDINKSATAVTASTARTNKVRVECITTTFLGGLDNRLQGNVDVLLFNPPYVPCDTEELTKVLDTSKGEVGVDAAWAGGKHGREVLDKLLPALTTLLSPQGCFYLVAIQQNNISDICNIMKSFGFSCNILLKKSAFNEILYILKFKREVKS